MIDGFFWPEKIMASLFNVKCSFDYDFWYLELKHIEIQRNLSKSYNQSSFLKS